ncbi:MAG TPA: hypothetical protein VG095_06715 [Chthoniobacterales bacterium]|nr:hypothetical protein [Chthoniobacterales bacterium]
MKPGRFRLTASQLALVTATVASVFFFGACAGKKSALLRQSGGKLFAVRADQTSFYRYGPQQGNGPDETLPKDTLMTLIRPSFGYCKVKLVDSEKEGYVASEDIQPAPPTLIAALNPTTAPSPAAAPDFDIRSSEPPPPESLPAPDLPPSTEPTPP